MEASSGSWFDTGVADALAAWAFAWALNKNEILTEFLVDSIRHNWEGTTLDLAGTGGFVFETSVAARSPLA
eukprot:CAMPEP_0172370084 /NCGR_PEP_ID=MMETSP1060-20121228/36154_1 /TAXON_ID=37318 /ORGANISM="Pseudo-nitzschia pungens, Strain cf. cingulata" /LENGTH=70 /DNA_ID=CAMNT_0013095245 /DNA_START=13 /DNA_END=225 /DNA_ORIENTATION=-